MSIENNIYDILIIILVILLICIIIKVIHNKIIFYNQNKVYQNILDEMNKKKELLLKKMEEQKIAEKKEEIKRTYRNLNINLEEKEESFIDKLKRYYNNFFKTNYRGILHQITNCNECDKIWCNKKNFYRVEDNVEDHYKIGVPLKDYGCDKIYDNMDIVQNSKTGYLYVVEDIPTSEKEDRINKHTQDKKKIYLLDSCNQCNIDWCNNFEKEESHVIDHYEINSDQPKLSDLGCDNINKTWKSVKDTTNDKIYIYQSIGKSESEKYIINLINNLEKDIKKENELEYKFNINIKNNKKTLLDLLYKKLNKANIVNLDKKIEILNNIIYSKKEQLKLVEEEKYEESVKLEENIKKLHKELGKLN